PTEAALGSMENPPIGTDGSTLRESSGGLAVYGALYAPLVASLVNSIALTYVGGVWVNYPLSLFKYALFVIPIADWLMLSRLSGKNKAKDISLVKVVLVCFMGLLILGTPWLYSYYFLGTTI
ncbi:MAG: hypothetical protein JRN13_07400, partial [Nitrososphaerota archaeon]|nr:hypothetical protein [Nitrososphaerota archaeon]